MPSQLGVPPVPLALLVLVAVLCVSWPHAAKRRADVEKLASTITMGRMGSLGHQGRQQTVIGMVGIAVPLATPPSGGQVPGR